MSKIRQILVILLVGILTSAWSLPPAVITTPTQSDGLSITVLSPQSASGTIRLTVNNKTGAVIDRLVLSGAKAYTFYNVPIGKSTFEIIKGKYKIEYLACGVNKAKKVTILSNYKFNTVSCPMAKINVINETGSIMTLIMNGPSKYRFTIPPGTMRINVIKGTYKYTGYCSCGTITGTINAKGRMRWNFWCR